MNWIVVWVLVIAVAHASITKPSVINAINFGDSVKDLELIIDDATQANLFALSNSDDYATMHIMPISPAIGLLSAVPIWNSSIDGAPILSMSSVLLAPNLVLVAITPNITNVHGTTVMVYNASGELVERTEVTGMIGCSMAKLDVVGVVFTKSCFEPTLTLFTWDTSKQQLSYQTVDTTSLPDYLAALTHNYLYVRCEYQIYQFAFSLTDPPASLDPDDALNSVWYDLLSTNTSRDIVVSLDGSRLIYHELGLILHSNVMAVFDAITLEELGEFQVADTYLGRMTLSYYGNLLLHGDEMIDISDPFAYVVLPTGFGVEQMELSLIDSVMFHNISTAYIAYKREMQSPPSVSIYAFDTSPIVTPSLVGTQSQYCQSTYIPNPGSLVSYPAGMALFSSAGPKNLHEQLYYMRRVNLTESISIPKVALLETDALVNTYSLYILIALGNSSQYFIISEPGFTSSSIKVLTMETVEQELDLLDPVASLETDFYFFSYQVWWQTNISDSVVFMFGCDFSTLFFIEVATWTWLNETGPWQPFAPTRTYVEGYVNPYPFYLPTGMNVDTYNTLVAMSFNPQNKILRTVVASVDAKDTVLLQFQLADNYTLIPTSRTTIYPNCTFLQSQWLESDNSMWVMCASVTDKVLYIFRLDPVTDSIGCKISHNPRAPTNQLEYDTFPSLLWQVTPNSDRLILVDNGGGSIIYYDISTCVGSEGVASIIANVPSPKLYNAFTTYEYTNGAVLLVTQEVVSGIISIFSDCPMGMKINEDLYCTSCPSGTFGPTCINCTAGFVCDESGSVYATQLCPRGYYCLEGTFTALMSNYDMPGFPLPCAAGTYCPPGVATATVTEAINSPKLCAGGYYCPECSHASNAARCPNNTNSDNGAKSISDCNCNNRYYGYDGVCILCPSICDCVGNTISSCYIPPRNMSQLSTRDIQPCPQYSMQGGNACNPLKQPWNSNSSIAFPCQEGYSDRFCSKCQSNYFSNGKRCELCSPSFKWKLPLAYAAVAALLTIAAWHATPKKSAIIQIAVFHFQSVFTLLMTGMKWHFITRIFLQSTSNASTFSMVAFECLFQWWTTQWTLVAALLTPVFATILAILACTIAFVYSKAAKVPRPPKFYRAKGLKVVVTIIAFEYFAIMLSVLQTLSCTDRDDATGKHYLVAYPWIECNRAWVPALVIALAGLVIVIVLQCLLWFRIVKIVANSKDTSPWDAEAFTTFYSVYNLKYFYWETIVTLRRSCMAILIALFPFYSPIILIGLFLVVLVYMMALMKLNPYLKPIDNIFDSCSQFVLLASIFVGVIVGLPIFGPVSDQLSIFVAIINALFIILAGLCLVDSFGKVIVLKIMAIVTVIRRRRKSKRSIAQDTSINNEESEISPLLEDNKES